MSRKWIAATVAALAIAHPALAETAATPGQTCTTNGANSGGDTSAEGQAHKYCEIRWSDLVTRKATGLWTHPDWVEHCVRRCRSGNLHANQSADVAAPILSTAAGIGLAAAAAFTVVHYEVMKGKPASP
jgi:hypothetical protein